MNNKKIKKNSSRIFQKNCIIAILNKPNPDSYETFSTVPIHDAHRRIHVYGSRADKSGKPSDRRPEGKRQHRPDLPR